MTGIRTLGSRGRNSRPGFLRFLFTVFSLLTILVFSPTPLRSANPPSFGDLLGYADRLMEENDYYGAASEYKKLLYFYPAEAGPAGVDERLCRVYLRAGEYSRLTEHINANKLFSPAFQYLSGLALFLQGECELSAMKLEKASATDRGSLTPEKRDFIHLVQAVNYARLGDLSRGRGELGLVPNGRPEMLEVKVMLKKDLDLYAKMSRKNPALALGLSVIPGAGLMYAGSWAEGIGTLLAGGISLYAGYQNFRDKDWLNLALWSAAFLYFYAKNFQSAWEKTKKYNEDADSFLLRRLNGNFYFQRLFERYSLAPAPSCSVYAIRRSF